MALTNVLGEVKGNKKSYKKLFKALDQNKNLKVDYSEFLAAAVCKRRVLTENNLIKAFKILDKDKDGKIS